MIGSPVAFSIVTSTPGSPRTATPNVDPIQNGKTMKNKRTPNTEIVPTWRTRTGQWWLYRIPPNDGRHSSQVLRANRRDQMAYGKAIALRLAEGLDRRRARETRWTRSAVSVRGSFRGPNARLGTRET